MLQYRELQEEENLIRNQTKELIKSCDSSCKVKPCLEQVYSLYSFQEYINIYLSIHNTKSFLNMHFNPLICFLKKNFFVVQFSKITFFSTKKYFFLIKIYIYLIRISKRFKWIHYAQGTRLFRHSFKCVNLIYSKRGAKRQKFSIQ